MKNKLITLTCALALGLAGTTRAFAANGSAADPGEVILDIALIRPACLVSTIVGSVFFVVGLPVAAVSKSVHSTAEALVVRPARATFTRPLGDLDELSDY
ncbi:MAG TPA: hypothetical protein VNT26_19830 [Candidatus Sulfotelmatobacter sp.]|nr:hypothetical protein [Candidatus Sulfotelmatobacter sp.]